MSKERLEQIRSNLGYNKFGTKVLLAWDEYSWLIEQAERAQELEEKLHFCEMTKLSMDSVEKYTEQIKSKNRRYREALEEIASEDEWETVDEARAMAREALEGEE